ncbi:MAG: hypothetical protein NXI18_13570 [Alphaproteobacteria bacterium]|nr:hypothetical protein [Alphaproteobacteria bacterium]
MPIAPIAIDSNPNYGGNLINQKYSPLGEVQLSSDNKKEVTAILNNRVSLLAARGLLPVSNTGTDHFYLLFFAPNNFLATVNRLLAPLIVVSSGRANWIQETLNAGNRVNAGGSITGYDYNGVFNEGPVPWYFPGRSKRQTIIVTHSSECKYYANILKEFDNVFVVGYKFGSRVDMNDQLVGFGASRFAAMQLAINLRFPLVWAVDDNVVNINGFPQAVSTVEGQMVAGTDFAFSFSAATSIKSTKPEITTISMNENSYNLANSNPGILQQCVLWQPELLKNNNLNFSPIFVSSNEDVSLSSYLTATGRVQKIIKPLTTTKYLASPDPYDPNDTTCNIGFYKYVIPFRQRIINYFAESEASIPVSDIATSRTSNLADFISNFLKSQKKEQMDPNLAQSQAVEQILSASMKSPSWIPPNFFNPYGSQLIVKYLKY